MIETYLLDRLAQRPLHAMARRWMCRGLHRVTRGEYVAQSAVARRDGLE